MKKRGSLKRLFNRFAAATLLSASLLTGTAAAQTAPAPEPASIGCPAYPEFKRPTGPMHRIPRDHTIDAELRADQLRLRQIGIDPGATDGLGGSATRAAIREFLMFYAPLYNGDANQYALTATDSTQLKKYADAAQTTAKTYKISTASAAAFDLASKRAQVPLATLVNSGSHKFDNDSWLYMVKTYGASYGMEFYASHISADANGKLAVDNPFIHRQLLDLKDHPRVSVLMTAEYIKHKDTMPALVKSALPALNETVRAQQADLMALGFDIGKSADGIKGDLTAISIGEFQLLYGNGVATGTLTAGEATTLSTSAKQARDDGSAYDAPTLAAGPIRMASTQNAADFGYMMKLADAESSFIHNARATTSTATGLFQFIEGTWSYMILNHGEKHGLGAFAAQVEVYKDELGREQARIPNPLIRRALLDMRANPQVSAQFGADFQGENKGKEGCYVEGELTRTDLYLAHFLGPSDAVWFITQMQKNPNQSAAATFPEEAAYNVNVFYARQKGADLRERSLKEVYDIFARKFGEAPTLAQSASSSRKTAAKPASPG